MPWEVRRGPDSPLPGTPRAMVKFILLRAPGPLHVEGVAEEAKVMRDDAREILRALQKAGEARRLPDNRWEVVTPDARGRMVSAARGHWRRMR